MQVLDWRGDLEIAVGMLTKMTIVGAVTAHWR